MHLLGYEVLQVGRLHPTALDQTLALTCKLGWTSLPLLTSLINFGIKDFSVSK